MKTIASIPKTADFSSIIRASQTLSSTTNYNDLLCQVAKLIRQNTESDYCALLLPEDAAKSAHQGLSQTQKCDSQERDLADEPKRFQIRAIATLQEVKICSADLAESTHLPSKLIQHVSRTQRGVSSHNHSANSHSANSHSANSPEITAYLNAFFKASLKTPLNAQSAKSILCQPLLNQKQVIGIVYLESQGKSYVFTERQQLFLDFLYNQAAISLENIRLHKIEQEKAKQLELSEAGLRNLYENAADPILLLSEKEFVDCNRAAVELFEATHKKQLCAIHPADISPEFQADGQSSFDKAQLMIAQGLQNGSHRFEWQHQTVKGKVFWAEVVLTPIRYQNQMVLHSIVRDISQRKAAEANILQKSQELEQAITQLKASQAQVIQAEKMSALGNLVAGVAHEINNPIGFLKGSINNLKTYFIDLQSQLSLYEQHYPQPVEAIQENAENIELDFIAEDLPKLLTSMQAATHRIQTMSTSLRNFSRADTQQQIKADLHEGIDSTLMILKYRLKADEKRPEIKVIKDYGELPSIDCFPGQLNQVFMNLLANAIDVFDEAAQDDSAEPLKNQTQIITVKTALISKQKEIEICITDNGKGMPTSVKDKIFDHLFTTKAVGKGTGLGLEIAKQIIVEGHGGTLTVESEPGQGTTFRMRLPIT